MPSPSGNAAPLRFARSIAAWYLLAVTAAYCLGGSRPKKSRKGGLALFAPFFDEEPKAEREAKEKLFASKYEAIVPHIRFKRKAEQLEKVRNRPSRVAKAVRKWLGTASQTPRPEGRIFEALKTEKAASDSIKLDKALSSKDLEKRQKLEIG